jgi:hypothetical protein
MQDQQLLEGNDRAIIYSKLYNKDYVAGVVKCNNRKSRNTFVNLS